MSDTQVASTVHSHTTREAWRRLEPVARAFIHRMQTWTPHRRPDDVFRSFVDIAALTLHQSPYHSGLLARDAAFERIERAYLNAIGPYKPDELDRFARLYSLAVLAFSSYPVTDFLGRIFIELGLHRQHTGQYFTPAPVAQAMAQIALHDAASLIAQQGFLTVMEPACGSGCMLIEAANVLHERGYNPAHVLRIEAADISRDCFNMAYAQLSWLNLQGVVRHRNMLCEDTWEHRATPMGIVMAQDLGLSGHQAPGPASEPAPTPPEPPLPGDQMTFTF